MKLAINIVDAFTDKQFKGNSAAVIILDDWLPDTLMQSIALENNLSETAFLVAADTADNGVIAFNIRWFSPVTEIDFCGHATLASAHVAFAKYPNHNSIEFRADAVGSMQVEKKHDGFIQMNFPNRAPTEPDYIPSALLDGLSIAPQKVLQNGQAYFAIYDNEDDVMVVEQDANELRKLAPYDVVVTAPGQHFDFVSRYFWPANGTDEDPVTGSIHTGLAPYWSQQLGKKALEAYQASKRGGVLRCVVESDRVLISGQTVGYLTGEITMN
jgi:PhzF family phenazine biosynthesis protein